MQEFDYNSSNLLYNFDLESIDEIMRILAVNFVQDGSKEDFLVKHYP